MANALAGFLQPPRSVFDYQQQLGQIDAGDVATQGARQQLAATAAQLQRDEADRNAFADLVRQSGGDQNRLTSSLLTSPSMGLFGKGQAAQKAGLDAMHTQAQTQQQLAAAVKATEDAGKTRFEVTQMMKEKALIDIARLPDAQAAIASIQAKKASGALPPEMADAVLRGIPEDPAQFPLWKHQTMLSLATPDAQLQAQTTLQGAPTVHQKEYTQYKAEELAAGRMPKSFEQFAMTQRKAAANNIDLKIDTKLGESVAGQVGPMLRESYEAANGAQQQIGTADQLIAAVDSKKLLSGPGATLRLKALQIGQSLGISGKDDAEVIGNTRAAIQGLAQSTVAARGALKGQGQVSDFEGKLLERAASGDIDGLTGPEIKQIALLNKRLAAQIIELHNKRVSKARANKATDGLADFYDIVTPGGGKSAPSAAPAVPSSGTDLGGGFILK